MSPGGPWVHVDQHGLTLTLLILAQDRRKYENIQSEWLVLVTIIGRFSLHCSVCLKQGLKEILSPIGCKRRRNLLIPNVRPAQSQVCLVIEPFQSTLFLFDPLVWPWNAMDADQLLQVPVSRNSYATRLKLCQAPVPTDRLIFLYSQESFLLANFTPGLIHCTD